MNATLVMKFGGSLTAEARSIQQIAQVIHAESLAWQRMVVVVSAMAGATDQLSRAVALAATHDGAGYRGMINTLRDRHVRLIDALFATQTTRDATLQAIDRWLFDALAVCDGIAARRNPEPTPRERDAAMSVGERLMTEIMLVLVQRQGLRCALIDGAALMATDDHFQNANPIPEKIEERAETLLKPVLDAGCVALTSGFIGSTRGGAITTLGRGGSDYTATMLAAVLRADEVWMWTHVDGIMSADPTFVPGARVIDTLSYDDMRELSYFGVRLVHPRAIEPLLPHKIPLRVRNPFNPDHGGTLIQADSAPISLRAVSAVDGFLLRTPGTIDLMQFLGQIAHLVGGAAAGPVITMQSQAQATVVFVVPTSEGIGAVVSVIERIKAGLHAARYTIEPVKVVAAFGGRAGLNKGVEVAPLAYAQGLHERALFAIEPGDTHSVVRGLHRLVWEER